MSEDPSDRTPREVLRNRLDRILTLLESLGLRKPPPADADWTQQFYFPTPEQRRLLREAIEEFRRTNLFRDRQTLIESNVGRDKVTLFGEAVEQLDLRLADESGLGLGMNEVHLAWNRGGDLRRLMYQSGGTTAQTESAASFGNSKGHATTAPRNPELVEILRRLGIDIPLGDDESDEACNKTLAREDALTAVVRWLHYRTGIDEMVLFEVAGRLSTGVGLALYQRQTRDKATWEDRTWVIPILKELDRDPQVAESLADVLAQHRAALIEAGLGTGGLPPTIEKAEPAPPHDWLLGIAQAVHELLTRSEDARSVFRELAGQPDQSVVLLDKKLTMAQQYRLLAVIHDAAYPEAALFDYSWAFSTKMVRRDEWSAEIPRKWAEFLREAKGLVLDEKRARIAGILDNVKGDFLLRLARSGGTTTSVAAGGNGETRNSEQWKPANLAVPIANRVAAIEKSWKDYWRGFCKSNNVWMRNGTKKDGTPTSNRPEVELGSLITAIVANADNLERQQTERSKRRAAVLARVRAEHGLNEELRNELFKED